MKKTLASILICMFASLLVLEAVAVYEDMLSFKTELTETDSEKDAEEDKEEKLSDKKLLGSEQWSFMRGVNPNDRFLHTESTSLEVFREIKLPPPERV